MACPLPSSVATLPLSPERINEEAIMRAMLVLLLGALLLSSCEDDVVQPQVGARPAAPRGLHSVTGDHEAFLTWLANTEPRITGYRVYGSDCGDPDCLYDFLGATTGTTFAVAGLANGRTKYFAVSAVNSDGRESDLSYDVVFDTPRPEGTGLQLTNFMTDSLHAGYEFSTATVRPSGSRLIDIYYGNNGSIALMVAPYPDTEIQDAGYASSLDAVDFAPSAGWSPTGTVELVTGHCYVVLAQGDHYAKFRVGSVTSSRVVLDWAYQVDPGNRELRAKPELTPHTRGARRPLIWPAGA
jgi:hypothetical protein